MPQTSSLTPSQIDEFERNGIVRLAGLLSDEIVRPAREVVLRQLAKIGLWRDGA